MYTRYTHVKFNIKNKLIYKILIKNGAFLIKNGGAKVRAWIYNDRDCNLNEKAT